MKVAAALLAVLAATTAQELRDSRQTGNYLSSPQQSRAPPRFAYQDDEGLSRNTVTPSSAPVVLSGQSAYRYRDSAASEQQVRPQPLPQVRRPPPPPGQQQQQQQQPQEAALSEEELEEEKPDRLTLLLPQSKFDCTGKTGYYADDGLNCEVFHYCQDNARHSWICPEGFLFHQVHLICMPPSGDNICKQSSQFHFVNDYLYLPINTQEVQTRPNVTLRYSDRYYPDTFYEDKEAQPQPVQQVQQLVLQQPSPIPQRIPVQAVAPAPQRAKPVQFQAVQRPVQLALPRAPQTAPPIQLRTTVQNNQVFRSPEEVNIPLQHRRPAPTTQRTYQPVSEDDDDYEYDDPPYRG